MRPLRNDLPLCCVGPCQGPRSYHGNQALRCYLHGMVDYSVFACPGRPSDPSNLLGSWARNCCPMTAGSRHSQKMILADDDDGLPSFQMMAVCRYDFLRPLDTGHLHQRQRSGDHVLFFQMVHPYPLQHLERGILWKSYLGNRHHVKTTDVHHENVHPYHLQDRHGRVRLCRDQKEDQNPPCDAKMAVGRF